MGHGRERRDRGPGKEPGLAAIAARPAADAHGLVPLAERIEDDPTNQTRFLTFTRAELRR